MDYMLLLLLLIVGVVFILIGSIFTSYKKVKLKLEKSFGKEPIDQEYKTDNI